MIIRNNNQIIIAGRAGADAEIKKSKKGNEFASFSVCANDKWFSVSFPRADVHKGDHVLVTGVLTVNKSNGKTYYNILADYVNAVTTKTATNSNTTDNTTDLIDMDEVDF